MKFVRAELVETGLDLAVASGAVCNFCDHVEHNEPIGLETVRDAGRVLRRTAVQICQRADRDPIELYAERLTMIERRNVLWDPRVHDGAEAARESTNWRQLQLVQVAHDRAYHADVVGLTKSDQLRHYALHLGKLAGATAAVAKGEASEPDWLTRRVPDMLLFGLKLSTVTGERLPDTAVEESSVLQSLGAAA